LDKLEILERFGFYRHAPSDLRSKMLGAARYLNLEPGEWLFREGERARQFAAVGAGSVRVFRIGATGRQITLYHVRAQESSLVGMLSVLLDRPVVATAQAEVASEVVVVPAADLRDWVSTSEAMRSFIFETMTRALVDVTSLLEDVAFSTMESRLVDLLLTHADELRMVQMRHDDIAAELGTAREVVSRLLEGFERRGAIVLSRGRIGIHDEVALRALG
jgi:CRP/FNR family transcriptional regulator, anaerobic regulatory protein